jgi:hypothetical protein
MEKWLEMLLCQAALFGSRLAFFADYVQLKEQKGSLLLGIGIDSRHARSSSCVC